MSPTLFGPPEAPPATHADPHAHAHADAESAKRLVSPKASTHRNPRSAATGRDTLRLCNLGSGSGGNSTLLHWRDHGLLIDAGFGPRTTERRLLQARFPLERVRAICVTHFDRDHFRPAWVRRLLKHDVTLYCHRWHLPDLRRLRGAEELEAAGRVRPFDTGGFEPLPGVRGYGLRLQHDRQGTIGFRFEADHGRGGSVGYLTDLGHAPPAAIQHLAGVDLLCIESNYDHHMTIHSSRPSFVNRRNLSDSGHLSNDQAFEAVQQIALASPHGNPRHILLLHRSSQCNHEMKVLRTFAQSPMLAKRVLLTHPRRRTRWLTCAPLRAVHRAQCVIPFA